MTAAQRGQIVQRVMVEGWSQAATAAAFGVPERLVALWVADYRRHGMASLRRRPGKSVAVEIARIRLLLPARAGFRRLSNAFRRLVMRGGPGLPSPLHRSGDDRRGRGV